MSDSSPRHWRRKALLRSVPRVMAPITTALALVLLFGLQPQVARAQLPGVDWISPSLALDSDGNPRISFWAKNVGNDLRYATWDAGNQQWLIEVVDDAPAVGQYTSVALDAAEHPHISYYDLSNADLKYATWDGAQWLVQTVDSAGIVGNYYSSIALDSAGSPHISYYTTTNGDLKYAYWDSVLEQWHIEIVDTQDNAGPYSSLALDSADQPHISYAARKAGGDNDLRYASGQCTTASCIWTIETVDEAGSAGKYSSLALDGSEHPRISYYDSRDAQLEGDLKYAAWNQGAGKWDIEVVDTGGAGGDVGRFSSLDLDSNGYAHIGYHDNTAGLLTYARWDGSQWNIDSVDHTVLVFGAVSLQLDADDQPQIAYGEKTTSTLRHARWDPGLGQWVLQTVFAETEAGAGYYNALELDSSLGAHIAYYDKVARDLRYAHRFWDGSMWQWTVETVDGDGRVGRYCSIDLDQNEYPHISYLDSLYLEQSWAAWDGTQWNIEAVPNSMGMGRFSSMALDANDYPHFASYGQATDDLTYAYWDGAQWHSEEVDTSPDSGWSSSIEIDGSGRPHISYTDASAGTVKYAHWTGTQWLIQTVASIGPSFDAERMGTSLALNAAGLPHISYFDSTAADLMLASYDGAAWTTQVVDSENNVGERSSLRFDGDGNPRIAYLDRTAGAVKYARWSGSMWELEVVDDEGYAGWYLSLALEPGSPHNPHISYMERDEGVLKYAHWDGGQWLIELAEPVVSEPVTIVSLESDEPVAAGSTMHFAATVTGSGPIVYTWDFGGPGTPGGTDTHPTFVYDGVGTYTVELTVENSIPSSDSETIDVDVVAAVGQHVSLDVDALNNAHVSYRDVTNGHLKYAFKAGAGWDVETIDGTTNNGQASSIAVDGANLPHISYFALDNRDLNYAHWDGSAWQTTFITRPSRSPESTSMAVDAAGIPHVGYVALGSRLLQHAWWDGALWQTEVVDGGVVAGGSISLVVDAADRPHFSYYDRDNQDLRYAYWDGAQWVIQTVDSAGDVGYAVSSLVLDAAGYPHVSYYDRTNGDLKYAKWDGSAWLVETVDSAGNVGRFSSLALSSGGRPRIAYYSITGRDLKFAARTGAQWAISTLDSADDVGAYASVALETTNRPHVAYYDLTNGRLKHAAWTGSGWLIETVDGPAE